MKVIVVDDEYLALEGTMGGLHKVAPEAEISGFQDPSEAIEAMRQSCADVALLDIEMSTMNGVTLAKELQAINPSVNIIFTTGYRNYMEDAFDLHVSGYVLKPITPEKLSAEFSHLRFPVEEKKSRVRVQTFGEFEIFIDDLPVDFTYVKSKELLAYLIDNKGAMVKIATLAVCLWEDDDTDHSSYLRNLISDLTHTLREHGCEDILIRRRGTIGVDTTKLCCDYFDYLTGDDTAARRANGEYMTQYSWAEVTHAAIVGQLI